MKKRIPIKYFTKEHLEYSGKTSLANLVSSIEGEAFEAIIDIEDSIEKYMRFVSSHYPSKEFFGPLFKTNEEDYI